jgi:hypothetical protein
MSIGLLFWVIFVVWMLFGAYRARADQYGLGYHFVVGVLLFLLGWRAFGFVIHN